MSSSNLLEQAIVDAQALRDSAYKSAQAALVEKFAPQIKEAVQKLLEQEEEQPAGMEGSPEDALAGDIPPGTDFGGAPPDTSNKGYVAGTAKDIPLAATDGEKLCPCPDDEEDVTLELNLADLADQLKIGKEAEDEEDVNMQPMLGGMQDQPAAAGGTGLTESLEIDQDLLNEEGEPAANIHDESMQTVELEEDLTEVDLDEVLSEMHPERYDLEDTLDDPKELNRIAREQEMYDSLSADEKVIFDKHPGKYEIVTLNGEVRLALKRKDHEDERVAKIAADAREAEREISESEDVYEQKLDLVVQEDEDLDEAKKNKLSPKQKKIASLAGDPNKIDAGDLAKLRQKTNESKEVQQTKELIKASSALLKEVENKDVKINKLLEENKKSSSIIEEMSQAFKKLEEVNVLNAKLFYENQVLKSASLNERQKINIVEAISKADSVSEAKTVYETLINSVGGQAEKERSPKSLNEAINKKSSFRLPHKQTEQPNDPNKDRWLKLAGIK